MIHLLNGLLLICCFNTIADDAVLDKDYQQIADGESWSWLDEEVNSLSTKKLVLSNYDVVLSGTTDVAQLRDSGIIEIRKGGQSLAKLPPRAVFVINKDCLTYAVAQTLTEPGKVVQIDLRAQKELWSSSLTCYVSTAIGTLGRIGNFSTRINLQVRNDELIYIWVNGDVGQYLDIKSAATGETVGHKLFNSFGTRLIKVKNLHEMDSAKLGPIDFTLILAEARWIWSDNDASPFYSIYCVNSESNNLRTVIASTELDSFSYTISDRDGRVRYSWRGHQWTVFRVVHNHLYYADWNPQTSGGEIVAVDLNNGSELWRTKLLALGPVESVTYSNRINIDVNQDFITIWGKETLGRYVEFKNSKIGETLAHKIFP